MDRSEPSLVPEWLRTNGGGSSINHFASSQADGPVSAFPGRSRSSKSFSNSDSLHSPRLDHSNLSDSRRSSNGNGFTKHDRSSYAMSYSSFSRNNRDRDRERVTITDSWDSNYSDPLKGMINGRVDDPLRRSKSLISRSQGDGPQRMRNDGVKNHYNGNGSNSVGGGVTSIQKVSFERDFPVLGSDERPKTPDIIRVSSPGFSRSIQSLSICNPPSLGSETWTSALVEVPVLQPAPMVSTSSLCSVPVPAITSSGLNMAEALVQAPAQALNAPQLQKDELALAQSKKLIPMTPVLPKIMGPCLSDKLKPKTALRSTETAITQKNGMPLPSLLQISSLPIRVANAKGDCPKSPSSNKLLLLKPGRENVVSPGLKEIPSPKPFILNRVANGHPAGNSSVAASPSKNSLDPKFLPGERKASGNGSTRGTGTGVDKRTSRSNFFKLMREKSLNNTSGMVGSGASVSSTVVEKSDKDTQGPTDARVTPTETLSELKCNGETCKEADSFSPSMAIDNEEERKFLLSLGWEDHDESDEEGLTEEEIFAFYRDEVMKQGPTSRLCRALQAKVFSHVITSSSTEANTPASQTEA